MDDNKIKIQFLSSENFNEYLELVKKHSYKCGFDAGCTSTFLALFNLILYLLLGGAIITGACFIYRYFKRNKKKEEVIENES